MKKTVGIIIALTVVIASGVAFLLSKKEPVVTERMPIVTEKESAVTATVKAVEESARYLPADAPFFLMLSNVKTMAERLPKSSLGRLLGTETVLAVMEEMRADPAQRQKYERNVKSVTDFFASSSFQLLFGDTFTVAALSLGLDAMDNADKMADLDPSFVVITTTRSPVTLQAFAALNSNLTVTPEEFDGLSLLKIVLPDEGDIFYAHIDGNHVLLSPARETIGVCMSSKDGSNLKSHPYLSQAEQYWADYPPERTYLRFYMNIESIMRSIRETKNSELTEALSEPKIKQTLEVYQSLEYAAGLAYTTDQSLETVSTVSFSPEKLHPMLKAELSRMEGKKNTSLHLLSSQPLLYAWFTPLNLQYLFDVYKADPAVAEKITSGAQELLGLTTDEIAATFGPQYGFTLDSIVNTGLFPIPKMSLWVEVRDSEKAKKALTHVKQITQAKGSTPSEEEVAGSTMLHWMLMPGDAGQPAVSLHRDTLYLTSSVSLMKAILNNTENTTTVPPSIREILGPALSEKIAEANASAGILYPRWFSEPVLNLIDFANNTKGGGMPVRTVKRELGIFLNSMDYVAGYCGVEGKFASCASTIKWAAQSEAVPQ